MYLTVSLTHYELTGSVIMFIRLILVSTDTQPVHIDDGLDIRRRHTRRHSGIHGSSRLETDKCIHQVLDRFEETLYVIKPRTCYDLHHLLLISETGITIRRSDERLGLITIDMF